MNATPVPEVVAHVAKDHALDVDGGAPVAGDIVHAAVHDRARVVPGTEHGLDGFNAAATFGILRELDTHFLLIKRLVTLDNDFLQVLGGQIGVVAWRRFFP